MGPANLISFLCKQRTGYLIHSWITPETETRRTTWATAAERINQPDTPALLIVDVLDGAYMQYSFS
jgi:hypothetical protein